MFGLTKRHANWEIEMWK